MRISDWSSDVCSSDLFGGQHPVHQIGVLLGIVGVLVGDPRRAAELDNSIQRLGHVYDHGFFIYTCRLQCLRLAGGKPLQAEGFMVGLYGTAIVIPSMPDDIRSEEHRLGKECVTRGSSRGTLYPSNT